MRLPSLRYVTRLVRETNQHWDGGEFATLAYRDNRLDCWSVLPVGATMPGRVFGREWLPGDNAPIDAVAVARRLLASAKDNA